jgi:thioredoxin 1
MDAALILMNVRSVVNMWTPCKGEAIKVQLMPGLAFRFRKRRTMFAVALLMVILGTFPPRCPASAPPAGNDHAGPNLTIVFFTASWCEPCHAVQPILEKFTRKHPKEVRFVPIDFDHSPDDAARWDVHKIPVVIVISKEGKILLRADGAERETLRTLPSALEDALKGPHTRS